MVMNVAKGECVHHSPEWQILACTPSCSMRHRTMSHALLFMHQLICDAQLQHDVLHNITCNTLLTSNFR